MRQSLRQSLRRSLTVAAIGCFVLLTTTPAQSAMSEAEQVTVWRYQLHRSYCAGNWTEAISLAGAMMGSQNVRQHERIWLFLLRQDMFNFQSSAAEFPGCQGGRVLAGITADETTALSEQRSIDWNKGLGTIGSSYASHSSRTQSTVPIAATTSSPDSRQETDIAAATTCPPAYEDDRRVYRGSLSSQWNYEIWQDTSRWFYVNYWRQHETCDQARTTSHHPTQDDARDEFMSAI